MRCLRQATPTPFAVEVQYRPNPQPLTPVATTGETPLRVTLVPRYRCANTSRLRRETRLQRWVHRNVLAPLLALGNKTKTPNS
ncbi:MAG: hypothetical protein V7K48_01245 [Nostoc sp.]|uniref:hypothetical protein n=1 Tax=Nostoc sp. TaxID=1180 RepID=UPI002FFB8DB0